jgi:hypothetical protein
MLGSVGLAGVRMIERARCLAVAACRHDVRVHHCSSSRERPSLAFDTACELRGRPGSDGGIKGRSRGLLLTSVAPGCPACALQPHGQGVARTWGRRVWAWGIIALQESTSACSAVMPQAYTRACQHVHDSSSPLLHAAFPTQCLTAVTNLLPAHYRH